MSKATKALMQLDDTQLLDLKKKFGESVDKLYKEWGEVKKNSDGINIKLHDIASQIKTELKQIYYIEKLLVVRAKKVEVKKEEKANGKKENGKKGK